MNIFNLFKELIFNYSITADIKCVGDLFSIKLHTTKIAKISDFLLKLIEKAKIRDFCDARIRNIARLNHKTAYAFYILLAVRISLLSDCHSLINLSIY